MDKLVVFSKQAEFQGFVDVIQRGYVTEAGWSAEWFMKRWPHILKSEYEHLNLPEASRLAVQDWERRHCSSFPWHYWRGIRSGRNLHSSQVLGLTILGTFIRSDCKPLERVLLSAGLLKPGEEIQESDFEYEPPNSFNESQRTSVDFMVRVGRDGGTGSPIYFEVKFLEPNFGQCSRKCTGLPDLAVKQVANQCLLTKEGIRYWEILPKLMDLGNTELGCPIQGPSYQLARNMLHLVQEGGRAFVVLSDARAKYLDNEVIRFVNFLAPKYRSLVCGMKFQQLVPYLGQADSSITELLARKYGIWGRKGQ